MNHIQEIKKELRGILSPGRWEHTLGVEYTCCALAMRYGADLNQARMAGLLHDCAKHYSGEELIAFCKTHHLLVNPYEEKFPELLHAKAGAYLAHHRYGVEEEAVLAAIDCHTTGKPEMNLLEKILYIADYIEPNRDRAPHLPELRQLAFEDIDSCLIRILSGTLCYLEGQGAVIDPATKAAYEFYSTKMEVTT